MTDDRIPDGTDDRRFYVLGKGRLIFDSETFSDDINLLRPRESTWTGSFRTDPISKAQLACLLGRDPVPYIVGHDPQKLLPSPQHFGCEPETFGQQFLLGMGHSLGLTYDEIAADYYSDEPKPEPTRWKKAVILVGDKRIDVSAALKAVSVMSNVLGIDIDIQPSSGELPGDLFLPRWNEPDATPLEDIMRWRDEMQMLDRFERVRPNQQLRTYAIGLMLGDKPHVEPLAKHSHKPYLKHDPTKQHRKRRRK